MPASYRDFQFPLNVFMHILTAEEGEARYLHYGLFACDTEPIASAQQRSTDLLLTRLPPPPARILDVGSGLGTTLARLTRDGYDAEGITPDEAQAALIRQRYPEVRVNVARFEDWTSVKPYDVVVFQESSQYIDSDALFAKACVLTKEVLVLDEFAARPMSEPGALHAWPDFAAAAARHGFAVVDEVDVSASAVPTINYIPARLERHRQQLVNDLGVSEAQIEHLIESAKVYRERYARGDYVYRIIRLRSAG